MRSECHIVWNMTFPFSIDTKQLILFIRLVVVLTAPSFLELSVREV